ncbi:MAG: ATP-grasp domain-containing protein [Phototrophicaceae bacterium]
MDTKWGYEYIGALNLMIVVLLERLTNQSSINAIESRKIEEAARMFGCKVYSFPSNIEEFDNVDDVFAYIPQFDEPILGIWVGVIPSYERYQLIYKIALKKNIHLINTPDQHRNAMEFDQFYPKLEGLTPKSVIIESLSEISVVLETMEFPLFVKGAIKSNKDGGWSAVVANNVEELEVIAGDLLSREHRSRGKIIIRELVQFNHIAIDPNGFPIGREYRAFVYKNDILAYGFYWDDYEDNQKLRGSTKQFFLDCLLEASNRVDTPFLSIDIGQLVNGDWIIIEIGDGQFSGLSTIPILELWSKIKDLKL